jgi:ribosomal-protein-alanine N-acetyltransferase|tara:strand:+ start:54 stop:611 length:558 start_codon:yes stop_codon:yes gene_type:complete
MTHNTFQELESERLKLTGLDESGLDDMHEYSVNPLLYKYFEFEPLKTKEETEKYLKKLIKRSQSETCHYWFIRLKDSGKVIGTFGVREIDLGRKNAEISYGLSPDYWGRGYFSEALNLVLDFLFNAQDFHRIFAKTQDDNLASIKSLEKIGFKNEGVMREFYLSHDGKRHDAVLLSILKPEFIKK